MFQLLITELKELFRSNYYADRIGGMVVYNLFHLLFATILVASGYILPAIPTDHPSFNGIQVNLSFTLYLLFTYTAIRILGENSGTFDYSPFLMLPFSRSKIFAYLLLKTFFSWYNLFPICFWLGLLCKPCMGGEYDVETIFSGINCIVNHTIASSFHNLEVWSIG